MDSKDKKILNDLEKNNSISLKNFLISYCGIYNEDLLHNKITHKDIKVLLPDLKRVSYDYMLENKKELFTGNILIVKDSCGNYAPYLNPKLNEYIDVEMEYEGEKKDNFEIAVELEKLTFYELTELCRKYKEENRIKEYRKVCKLIKKMKNNGIDEYHRKKEKMLLKGFDENDKY